MKKIQTIVKSFAVFAAAAAFFSCSDIMNQTDYIRNEAPASEITEETDCAVIRFNVKEINKIEAEDFSKIEGARTVLPVVAVNDLTDFSIKGNRTGYSLEKTFGPYADITELSQANIVLPHAYAGQSWNFELTAKKGGTIFRSYVEDVELKVKNAENPDTEVNFVLSLYDVEEGNGNFSYTLDYSSDFAASVVTGVNVVFENFDYTDNCPVAEQNFNASNLTNKKFTITESNVPYGKYRAKITLYAGDQTAGYWQDVIHVYPDLTSSKTLNISLKKYIKFIYVLNEAGDATLEFTGDEFIKKSREINLPLPKRSEYVCIGWYTDSGLTQPFDSSALTENEVTVYAKWGQKNFTVPVDEAASLISTISYGTQEDPVCLALTGTYTEDVFENIKSAIETLINSLNGNPAPYFYIDLSEIEDLTEIPERAFENCSIITGIKIPATVTDIGQYAFSGCNSLEQITLPSGLKKIDQYAFQYTAIKQITIPKSVTELDRAFYQARDLESVTFEAGSELTKIGSCCFAETKLSSIVIPDSVTTLEWGSFNSCPLTSVTLGSGIKEIQSETFMYNSSLTSITIPEGITSIGNSAFRYSGLTSVNIPDSVTTIESSAFCNCQSLTTVTIGKGITSIGDEAFRYCPIESFTIDPDAAVHLEGGILYNTERTKIVAFTDSNLTSLSVPATITELPLNEIRALPSLESITVASGCAAYSSSNGVLFTKDGTGLLVYPSAKAGTSYTIPSGVTYVDSGAFKYTANLTSIDSDKTWYSKETLSGIFIASGPQKIYSEMVTNHSGYIFTIFDLNINSANVYNSQNLDMESGEYTIIKLDVEPYTYTIYEINTQADVTYCVSWVDSYSVDNYSNVPADLDLTDSVIYIYDNNFNLLKSTDDAPTLEFTATGKSYIAVVDRGNGSCNCAFRAYKK